MAAEAPTADRADIAAPSQSSIVERALEWAERVLPAIWAERGSRLCLLAAIAFLWLSVALGTIFLLIPMVAASVGIYMRRDKRAAASADLGDPDFF